MKENFDQEGQVDSPNAAWLDFEKEVSSMDAADVRDSEIDDMGTEDSAEEHSAGGESLELEQFLPVLEKIIKHPGFSFEDSGAGSEYSDAQKQELFEAIKKLKERVETERLDIVDIPDRLEAILADNEQDYPFNNDYSDIRARTAYELLCGNGSNCIGYSETCCIMLSLYGYKPAPILSRLNKTGAACHYVTAFENSKGDIEILDPERRRSCSEPQKRYDLTAYQASLSYATPTMEFSAVKMTGDGIGPAFDAFFADKEDKVLRPMVAVGHIVEPSRDDMEMYERAPNGTSRINLKEGSMSSRKKQVLDEGISGVMRPIYEQSLAMMGE